VTQCELIQQYVLVIMGRFRSLRSAVSPVSVPLVCSAKKIVLFKRDQSRRWPVRQTLLTLPL